MKKLFTILGFMCFALAANAQVIINEVQADAGNNEGGGEWVELKNIGATAVDLSCWKLTNGGNVQVSFPQGLLIGPGEYLLIGNAAEMMCANCDYKSLQSQFTLNPDGYGYGIGNYAATQLLNTDLTANGGCGCLTGSGGFNNGSLNGDRVVLLNDAGVIQDAIQYGGGDYYGTGALTVNFPGTATCGPLNGVIIPAVGDVVYSGREICNDLGGCNSSYARLPDGNNGALVSWAQSGNLACTGCLDPCGASTNSASADYPTPGLTNTITPWTASLNANPVTTTASSITVCGATPFNFEYQIFNFTNAALTALQSTGNLGSYVRIGNGSPISYATALFNPTSGITTLTSSLVPPIGTTTYEFVWGDANTLCATCPGSTSTATANNVSSTAKECYVYHTVTVTREEPLGGSPVATCSLPGSIVVSGATGTNLEYTLQKQTTIGGPFVTVAGPQTGNAIGGVIDDDADPLLPNYQVLVSSTNTVCTNPTPIIVSVPTTCLGNPACVKYVTSGPGMPTYTPAGGTSVCAGSTVNFTVDITGVCGSSTVDVLYDFNSLFDPYTQGTLIASGTTTVGATPAPTTAPGRVYISEFVPRPYNVAPCAADGSNPNSGEYIELYNAGPGNVDVSGWMITDGDWTTTIPAGIIMAANSYYLIGGGGTLCFAGVVPDLNVETCNCTGGTNSSASGEDFMNFTNSAEGFGLFDCSNNLIDGVRWGTWNGDATTPASLPAGCNNYLTSKTPVMPTGTGNPGSGFTNSGGSFSGTNGGRARDASGNWTVTVNNSQFGSGFNGTPKAANGAFVMWDGGTTAFGTQCPPPPVTANINVTLPDTCSQAGPLLITLKAIAQPQPVTPCTDADVIATATYLIPSCPLLTLTGDGSYCNPALAPLVVTPNTSLTGNYDITLSNGTNTATITGATGSGPFSTNVVNGGTWNITNVVPPAGVCPPKTEGSPVVNVLDIPVITSSPASTSFCYSYGFNLNNIEWQLNTNPQANTFIWYDQPSGGSPLASTFVNPTANTTYYVAPSTGNPANCEGTRVPVLLEVTPLPATPNVSCNGITATFTPQSPNCSPIPCPGIQYSANGIDWSSNTSYTAADPGWAGWGSPFNSSIYIRNSAAVNCFSYVTFFGPCSAALPAQLINFNGQLINNSEVVLTWDVMNEDKVSHYEIERGNSATAFNYIGKTLAKGTGPDLIRYSHSDLQPLKGLNFYRLKIVDEDGKYTYSKTISVLTSTTTNHIAGLFPNPASDKLMVDLNLIKAERASIQVIDMTGRVISDRSAVLKAGLNNLEFDIHSIAKGQYMVRVSLSSGVLVRKFIKD
jgi:hypothetical protein